MKKENNAAVLTLLTDANLTSFFIDDATPLCNFEFWKKKSSIVNKRLFLPCFHSWKFFHELCKKWNLKGNSIELSTFLKYGLTEVKKAPSWMFDLVLNMHLWA